MPRLLAPPVPPPPDDYDKASNDSESSIEFELEITPGNDNDTTHGDDGDDGEEPECSVCFDALWEPIRLPTCGHIFCRACLAEVCRRGAQRCPLCRRDLPGSSSSWNLIDAPIVAEIETRLREHFHETWERRRAEAELRTACSISFCVGHRRTGDLVHLLVAVTPPNGWRPRRAGGPDASALLIDVVNFTLPPVLTNRDAGESAIVEVLEPPFELHRRLDARDAQALAAVHAVITAQVVWKRKLGVAPLDVEHVMRGLHVEGAGEATPHEVRLPEGLTLAHVLTRMRPVARIGVGSGRESEIYR